MKIILALIVFASYTLHAQVLLTLSIPGQNKFATCSRKWVKIGCFKDNMKPSRPLPEMLLNDRDRHSKYHQLGYRLNWHRWTESTHSLACRCAEKASLKGYTVFGLQFYGECWSGPNAELNFNRDGGSSNCIMSLNKPTDCDQSSSQECVGAQKTNYIYRLTDNPGPQTPDIDGNYTNWSEWSECSKTCGGGEKVRERSCTNPPPQGNGRPCVGDTEDVESCNTQECVKENTCKKKMDIGIIVDSSSSVHRKNFEKVKDFLIKLVDKMDVNQRTTHVGIIRYNHKPFLNWDFNTDVAMNAIALKEAIRKLEYKPGGTRTDRALEMAKKKLFQVQYGERPSVPHVALVVTDGKTSLRSKKYEEVLKPFKEGNVTMIAVGVGPSVDKGELTEIAMGDENNVIEVDRFDELVSKIKQIIELFCNARKLL